MFSVLLSSCRNTSGSLGEREMLWKHEPLGSVSAAFFSKICARANITQYDEKHVTMQQNTAIRFPGLGRSSFYKREKIVAVFR